MHGLRSDELGAMLLGSGQLGVRQTDSFALRRYLFTLLVRPFCGKSGMVGLRVADSCVRRMSCGGRWNTS